LSIFLEVLKFVIFFLLRFFSESIDPLVFDPTFKIFDMSSQSITSGLDHHPLALAYIFKSDLPSAQNQWFFALLNLPRSIVDLD